MTLELWVVVGLLVVAALVVAGLAYWYYQKGKVPPTPVERIEPFEPLEPFGPFSMPSDVDYFHSGSYFTLGYFTDHYFTLAGSGVPVVTKRPFPHQAHQYPVFPF